MVEVVVKVASISYLWSFQQCSWYIWSLCWPNCKPCCKILHNSPHSVFEDAGTCGNCQSMGNSRVMQNIWILQCRLCLTNNVEPCLPWILTLGRHGSSVTAMWQICNVFCISWDTTTFISVVELAYKLFLWNYCLYWQQFEQKSFVAPWLVREGYLGLGPPSGAHSKNHDISSEETPKLHLTECRYAAATWSFGTLNKRSTKKLLSTVFRIFALWKPFFWPNDTSESYLSLSWEMCHACIRCIYEWI